MKEPRTTLIYRGQNYPFYRTNRGTWDFENAGFSTDQVAAGSQSAMLALVYFTVRDCAKRASLPFTDSLDDFIDNTDVEIYAVFGRLQSEQLKLNAASEDKTILKPGDQNDEDQGKTEPEESPAN